MSRRRTIGYLIAAALVVVCAVGAALGLTTARRTHGLDHREISVAGKTRSYEFHVPEGQHTEPLPAIIVLHGGGGNGRNAATMTGLSALSDREGFLVVYPNGSGSGPFLTWNAGHCCQYAMKEGVDDVAFISALIDDLVARGQSDPSRIYVTGMSNGAMMAHRLARELPDQVAAIAPVVGAVFGDELASPSPVPALLITGALDQNVPTSGGYGERIGTEVAHDAPYARAGAAFDYWASTNDCAGVPARSITAVFTLTQGTHCAQPVVWYHLTEGTHSWPGGEPGRRRGDQPVASFDASQRIWEFFDAKRLTEVS